MKYTGLEKMIKQNHARLCSLEEELEKIKGGALHVRKRGDRYYYWEYDGKQQVGITRNKSRTSANPYKRDNLKYATSQGVMTRSKSERHIGNVLEERGCVYVTEPEIIIDGRAYYPDFMILRADGTSVIWEHCGSLYVVLVHMSPRNSPWGCRNVDFRMKNRVISGLNPDSTMKIHLKTTKTPQIKDVA